MAAQRICAGSFPIPKGRPRKRRAGNRLDPPRNENFPDLTQHCFHPCDGNNEKAGENRRNCERLASSAWGKSGAAAFRSSPGHQAGWDEILIEGDPKNPRACARVRPDEVGAR